MSENTKIEWADHSWSPWRGCTKVSPGCANCYAETLSKRNPAVLGQWGKGKPRVKAKNWKDPVKWNRIAGSGTCKCCGSNADTTGTGNCKRCGDVSRTFTRPRVFPSLCDWLDEEIEAPWIMDFLNLIRLTPNLDWLLLTKRPENFERIREFHAHMRSLYIDTPGEAGGYTEDGLAFFSWFTRFVTEGVPNVWHGTSVEDQKRADERIPELLKIPAAVRFLSVEPLLGPVDLAYTCFNGADSFGSMPGIHWVIVGGESGPGARPCTVKWIRDLVRQCKAASVPCFVKQLGALVQMDQCVCGRNVSKHWKGPSVCWSCDGIKKLTHPKGGDPAEWPEDLRVREFPR